MVSCSFQCGSRDGRLSPRREVYATGSPAGGAASLFTSIIVALGTAVAVYPFHAIERIEWPFMVMFFVLAGASLELHSLAQIGLLGTAYIALRIGGRVVGGWIGGRISGADQRIQHWMGVALMPQAGVALGMALIASERFPDLHNTIMPLIIGTTVFFELLGPICTRLALIRAGETAPERS